MTFIDDRRTEAEPATPVGAAVWSPAGIATEQRAAPRVALTVPVAFRNGAGQHCAARLSNLSPDGLQVRCNVATAQTIYPYGLRLQPDDLPLLHATAVLPLVAGPETLSIGVRLLYCRTEDEGPLCVMGFRFLDPRPKARRIIDTFFAEQFSHFQFGTLHASDNRAA